MVSANFRYIVFLAIIIVILFIAGLAATNMDLLLGYGIWIFVILIFLIIISQFDFVIPLVDYQRIVIYRFGKVNRVGGPGWTFIWPIIESFARVDLRTKTIDVPSQEVVTKDNIELKVDAIIYLKVKKDNQSVVNSIIEVEDYVRASNLYVISSIRDVIGSMVLSEVISNIEVINTEVKENLEKISKDWGIAVESVEIKDIQIPDTVIEAMHEEKAAVQQKLARMERALAHKAEIQAVQEAASGLDDKALAYYYIKAIENMSNSKGSKVFFPAEFSNLAGMLSGMSSKNNPETSKAKDMLKEYVENAVKKTKKEKKGNKKK